MSEEAKHTPTPGPWTLDGPCGFANENEGAMVYAPHGNGHLVAAVECKYAPNQMANARLIAAAPQLLSACEAARDFGSDYALEMLEAAIAAAKGENNA